MTDGVITIITLLVFFGVLTGMLAYGRFREQRKREQMKIALKNLTVGQEVWICGRGGCGSGHVVSVYPLIVVFCRGNGENLQFNYDGLETDFSRSLNLHYTLTPENPDPFPGFPEWFANGIVATTPREYAAWKKERGVG